MAVIDHLVYAVPDLDAGIDQFELATSVRPAIGGAHPGMGTHNALVSLGESYIEIIAPDPNQPDPSGPRPFGVSLDMKPQLVTYAVRPGTGETIESLAASAAYSGSEPGEIMNMSRTPPSGETLSWRLTSPLLDHDGVIPFLIEWGATRHPSATAPTGLALRHLDATTNETVMVANVLRAMDLDLSITAGSGGLTATIDSPNGIITLT